MNKGFVLAETLIVTAFVASVLIYLFIQFTNLNSNYNDSYNYNTVEGLYSLRNIRYYILRDNDVQAYIENNLLTENIIDVTDCSIFEEDYSYCKKLFELENIKRIFITKNKFDKTIFLDFDIDFQKFINKINSEGNEKYRLLVEFNDSTYATIRFGE